MKNQPAKKTWAILDAYDPVVDGFPKLDLSSEEQLLNAIDRFNQRPPNVVIVESPTGKGLIVGLGHSFGFVQCRASPGKHQTAYGNENDDEVAKVRYVDYSYEGIDYRIYSSNLLLFDEILKILVYFFRNDDYPTWVKWGTRVHK